MPFGVTSTKGRRFPVEILSAEEVRAILAAAGRRRGACGIRDRALVATLYRGGLRISEALDLMPKDIDLSTGAVAILDGKGHRARTVAVDGETVALIELWLASRAAKGLTGRQTLFCTLEGKPMSGVQVRQHLKALAMKAGIEKRVHPHGFRHSRAVDLMRNGVDVKKIQQALGHGSLATTDTYLSHVAPLDVLDAMRSGTW